MQVILAGDIGGTKTHLALYARDGALDKPLRTQTFVSRQYRDLAGMCADFLQDHPTLDAAAFGIAGPVIGGRVTTTNLPWVIDSGELARDLGLSRGPGARLRLLNDLEAMALGALHLPPWARHKLQPGLRRHGHIAVLAAGTGLGQAQLFWDGVRHLPGATEGGHVEFAPSDEREIGLLRFARAHLEAENLGSHVSWERIASGPGLALLYRYLVEVEGMTPSPQVAEALQSGDPSAVVGQLGVQGGCPVCEEAVRWFARLLGRQAGNWALSLMAVGGVLIGGGVAPKLLPVLSSPAFLGAFADKGRYRQLMTELPIDVILDERAGLYGAAVAARQLLSNLS